MVLICYLAAARRATHVRSSSHMNSYIDERREKKKKEKKTYSHTIYIPQALNQFYSVREFAERIELNGGFYLKVGVLYSAFLVTLYSSWTMDMDKMDLDDVTAAPFFFRFFLLQAAEKKTPKTGQL